jgi:hypothetical protein
VDEEEIKRRVIFGAGYGRPPEHSQFKKGQSGNPKGRPKTMPSELISGGHRTLNIILDIADRDVSVRENGEAKSMKMLEVAVNALFVRSGKGDPRALATLLALTQKAEIARAQHVQKRNEAWQAYKDHESAKIARARATGERLPTSLPHPDDIVIDLVTGPSFLGPVTDQEQVMLDHTLRVRDLLILKNELDYRSSTNLDGVSMVEPGGAELLALVLEKFVPPRLQLLTGQWLWRAMRAEALPKRKLLKQLHEDWRELGYPRPRGFVFPELSQVKSAIEKSLAIIRDVQKLPQSSQMGYGIWERAAAEIILRYAGERIGHVVFPA